jgi:hypothetical protein
VQIAAESEKPMNWAETLLLACLMLFIGLAGTLLLVKAREVQHPRTTQQLTEEFCTSTALTAPAPECGILKKANAL